MISWLLAVVLLSATNAITTPTSTEPAPKPTTALESLTTTTTTTSSFSGIITPANVAAANHQGEPLPSPPPPHLGPLASLAPLAPLAAAASTNDGQPQTNVMPTTASSKKQANQNQKSISGAADLVHDHLSSDQRTRAAPSSSSSSSSPSSSSSSSGLDSSGAVVATAATAADGPVVAQSPGNNIHHSKSSLNSTLQQQQQQQANQIKNHRQQQIYTNQFVIQVEGGELEAQKLAHKHGFIYLNHILGDYYHLEHRRLARRSLSDSDMSQLEMSIEDEPQVLKLERQVLKKRVKRDFLELSAASDGQQQQPQLGRPANNQQVLRPSAGRPAHHQLTRPANQPPAQQTANGHRRLNYNQHVALPAATTTATSQSSGAHQRTQDQHLFADLLDSAPSGPSPFFVQSSANGASQAAPANLSHKPQQMRPLPPPLSSSQATGSGNSTTLSANSSLKAAPFSDPSWPLMWYLDGGARNGFDLNVQAAWRMGYTGKGIVITILDDGLEKDHPDLQANYDPLASFDINGDDADPMPRYDIHDSNRHGTRCAGEVAAVPGNNICSIGIAYNSRVGGVRMLDGDVTDAVEARSLGLNNQHIHIYSASWGPDDNGKTVDGPGELATRAFIEGVTNGRQGLGSIFVFASGNGGREHDNCNCDGYTNSIWTLSISSATENGFVPWYIESCSSTLATTYSSGSYDERQIATTDIRHSCTSNHTGTSASAPLAAGICALVLESNPRLTWRDMQHIVVRTAKPANLVAKDWRANALGRNVSHAFGYGLMDAAAMITMAKQWTTVPVQYTCEVRSPQMEKFIPSKGYIELKLRAECANVRFLEHVQSKVTLTSARRGDLHIYLTSPLGTRSTLLAQRPNDQAEQGFRNWPFMTVHSWGESPNGIWTLEVHNDGKPQNRAYLKEWTLILYGTYDDPNKHLDPSSLTGSIPMAATPAPPQQHQQHSSTHTQRPQPNRVPVGPVIQSAPPAPSFSPTQSDLELGVPQRRPPPGSSQQPATSPPPPPINGKQPSTTTTTTTSTTTTTTPATTTSTSSSTSTSTSSTSSYVTTFKTIVNTSPTGRPTAAGDPQLQQPNNRLQSPAGRTDFEVVAPPGANTNTNQNLNSNSNGQLNINDQRQHQWSFPSGQGQDLMSTTSTKASPGANESDFSPIQNNIHKPSIDQLDEPNSKTELQSGSRPTGANNNMNLNGNQRQQQHQQHQAEIDTNHLDNKQTVKDYRSSGGQQMAPTTTTTVATNELQSEDSSSSSSATRQNDSSSASRALNEANFLLQLVAVVVFVLMMTNSNVVRVANQHQHQQARWASLIAH